MSDAEFYSIAAAGFLAGLSVGRTVLLAVASIAIIGWWLATYSFR